jgi:hypothetical protein
MTTTLRTTIRSTSPSDRRTSQVSASQPRTVIVTCPTPQELAQLHNRYYSALWRGDDVSQVADWLASHWTAACPPEPARDPDAVSLYGGTGAGRGIRWYRFPFSVIGYIPGEHCAVYRVNSLDALPRSRELLHGGER